MRLTRKKCQSTKPNTQVKIPQGFAKGDDIVQYIRVFDRINQLKPVTYIINGRRIEA